MHWYVRFRDPQSPAEPSLFEGAGGLGPLTRMARLLYEKYVPADALLAAAFAEMPADQPQRLARWLAAAFGGSARPRLDGGTLASVPSAIFPAGTLPLTEDQRARWVSLIGLAADEAGLPADAAFRSAWSSCIEWVSREAALPAPATGGVLAPVSRWDWGPGGPPNPLVEEPTEDSASVALPGPDEPLSFVGHIRPLFRQRDCQSMSFAFDLWSADDVRLHATEILARLQDGSMPCDGAWPAERIEVFRRWTHGGMHP
jgi:truncated hemoglobin YjbI